MSVTIKGRNGLSEPVKTIGETVDISEEGAITVTSIFIVRSDQVPNFLSEIEPVHPVWSSAKRSNVKATREEGNQSRVTITYDGADSSSSGTIGGSNKKYELKNTLQTEPIESHPKFFLMAGFPYEGAEKDEEGRYIGNADEGGSGSDLGGVWEGTGQKAQFVGWAANSDAAKSMRGIEQYLTSNLVWQETIETAADDPPTVNMRTGVIDTPDGNPPDVNAQEGGNRTWLLWSATQRTSGNRMTTVRQWRLSGERGWNTILYDPSSPFA